MQIDRAARVDLLYDTRERRLYFLECDAAPLIHSKSALAQSLETARMRRREQLDFLLGARVRTTAVARWEGSSVSGPKERPA